MKTMVSTDINRLEVVRMVCGWAGRSAHGRTAQRSARSTRVSPDSCKTVNNANSKHAKCAKVVILLLMAGLSGSVHAAPEPAAVDIRSLDVRGKVEGDNITFEVAFTARVQRAGAVLPLARGSVALLDAPQDVKDALRRDEGGYTLVMKERGDRKVSYSFAARPERQGDLLRVNLSLPDATVRRIAILCDRDDLDIRFDHALDVKREKTPAGVVVSAYFAPGQPLGVRWMPRVQRLAGELVVECDVNALAVARAGALRLDSLYTFRIVQGALSKLSFDLPAAHTVTQVGGQDVREWSVEKRPGGGQVLTVALSRPQEKTYQLQIEHELALPPLPCEIDLAPLAPRDVMRASGFVYVGAEGAVRLIVKKASGLTQIDQAAFPAAALPNTVRLERPERGGFAYQFANLPYRIGLAAEDVVTSLQAEERLSLSLSDNDASLEATVDVDVRDASTRELLFETEPEWNLTAVEGENVSDYDVRDEKGIRQVRAYFRTPALGRQLLTIRLERTLPAEAASFPAPRFALSGARAERGYVALRGELGVTLRASKEEGLREVPVGSLPVKVPGAQYAARFKAADWRLDVAVVREQPAIDAEVFDLVTFGESAVYGSSLVTYIVRGAPVRTLRLAIPAGWRNVEITGRDVRTWRNDGTNWVVSLQEKVIGDYTLLVTYDQPVPYERGELSVGGLRALDAANSSGYLALAAPPGVALAGQTNQVPGLLSIAVEELPPEYRVMIKDPVLRACKYPGPGTEARVAFQRYQARELLNHAADLVLLTTRLSSEGESVTEMQSYIKNASSQYLAVDLPPGARLWSLQVNGEKVQALERGAGKILVALPRRLDPNEPSRVAMAYATQGSKPGWRSRVDLLAPGLGAQSIYARWTVFPPLRHVIAGIHGDLTPPPRAASGVRDAAQRVALLASTLALRGTGWLALGLLAAGFAALVAFNAGRGALLSWGSWIACTLLILLSAAVFLALPFRVEAAAPPPPVQFAQQTAPVPSTGAWTLSKPVTLSEGGLQMEVALERDWVRASRLWGLPIAGAAAMWLLAVRMRRKDLALPVGLCVALWAAVQVPRLVDPVAWLVLVLVLLSLSVGLIRRSYLRGLSHRRTEEPPMTEPEPQPAAGMADPRLLACMALLAVSACAVLAQTNAATAAPQPAGAQTQAKTCPPPPAPPRMIEVSRAELAVDLPAPGPDLAAPMDALAELKLAFHAGETGDSLLLPKRFVMTSFEPSSRKLEVVADDDGYRLKVLRAGDYTLRVLYRAPIGESNGTWQASLWIPPHLVNEINVKMPSTEWTVDSPGCVYLRTGEGKEAAKVRIVAAGTEVPLAWRPRARVASLEQASFFAEFSTVARVRSGLLNLTHLVRFQVAQGEVQTFKFEVPAGATVTAVSGPGLGTWRFDTATRRLEAVLNKPVSGDYALKVVTQIAREGLPYDAEWHELIAMEALRQRGVIALVADDGVQVVPGEPSGCAPMFPGDFPAAALAVESGGATSEVRRAYRYQETPVALKVAASRVEPELRVAEDARVDVTDERTVLSSRLQIEIAKAGVFTVWLDLPEGFDIDALSGDEVSHWDDVREKGRAVAVHFTRQVLGMRTLNLVLSRQERSVREQIDLPRVSVRGALKHTGTLVVSAERGLRLSASRREGAAEVNPRDIGIQQPGYLAYRLLRPDWALSLKSEAAQAVVKSEVVQCVTVSEGLLHSRCRVHYNVEHVGVKTFALRAPRPGVSLAVTGPGIARVQESGTDPGRWDIELQSKREGAIAFDVVFQESYEAASGRADIRMLRTEGVESQKGYVVLLAGNRLEVKMAEQVDGLAAEDPRAVPARLGAGDLSGAALCFRATRGDIALPLLVTRHEAADQLLARVTSVELTSVLAEDGSLATSASLQLQNCQLRFLPARLPKGAVVWSVFVGGRAVRPLSEGDRLLIPTTSVAGGDARVEIMYGARLPTGWFGKREVPGPAFDLPLQNVTWRLYVPPGAWYRSFGGSLTYREGTGTPAAIFTPETYEARNRFIFTDNMRKATEVLQQGQELSKAGRQVEAKQALEEAIAYSQGDRGLNEDARIQFRSLARQQAVVGLATRRSNMKIASNAALPEDIAQSQQFNAGNFSADVGRQVEQNLGAKESDSLGLVADKLLDQQVAAAADVHPVRVTMPLEGRILTFDRELQVQPDADLRVWFTAGTGRLLNTLIALAIGLAALALFSGCTRFALVRAA
jgi:hypothetical protein